MRDKAIKLLDEIEAEQCRLNKIDLIEFALLAESQPEPHFETICVACLGKDKYCKYCGV